MVNSVDELKATALAAIDRRRDWLIDVAKAILRNPETGFREVKTSRLVSEKLAELGIAHERGIALTGLKGYLTGSSSGPTVALLGELDSIRVPAHPNADPETGAAHACGHHCQPGMMLGAAVGLMAPEVLGSLSGRVALMALPAEEFIDVEYRWRLRAEGKLGLMSGKQEFIRLGMFDDVEVSMMAHTIAGSNQAKFSVGGTSNGHVVKHITFTGKSAHAGSSPHRGVNALQAAMIALNALNTQRETFRNDNNVRLHGIVTSGGASANAVPDEVKYEGRVRGTTEEAIADASTKMDRCLKAGALALGAGVNIVTIPGYLPIINNRPLMSLFKDNAVRLVGEDGCVVQPDGKTRGGSTDMGDLSNLMPVIHPYTSGATGMGHGADYVVEDYEQAVIKPAKALAMTVIDLLVDGAAGAKNVVAKSPPRLTKGQYLRLQNFRLSEERYEEK